MAPTQSDPVGAASIAEGGEAAFFYHRAVAPMLWMLVAIGMVELTVTHLLIAIWHPLVAAILSALTLGSLAWLSYGIVSMRRRPVLLGPRRLVMRTGTIRSVEIPIAAIAGLRESWTAEDVRDRSTLNLALVAYPNIVVDLLDPLPGRRRISAIAHRLDEPAAFASALERLRAGS